MQHAGRTSCAEDTWRKFLRGLISGAASPGILSSVDAQALCASILLEAVFHIPKSIHLHYGDLKKII